MSGFYHDGMRALQDRRGTRALADRLVDVFGRSTFSDDDRAFIESRTMAFLATADAVGAPECSYKGGPPGFLRVDGPADILFPVYDGNGMYRSLGNIAVNPSVGLLLIDFETPRRLRVNGVAIIVEDEAALSRFAGAELAVRVTARAIFPNCPRYIHQTGAPTLSPYTPSEGVAPPIPGWKRMDAIRDALPADDPARGEPTS